MVKKKEKKEKGKGIRETLPVKQKKNYKKEDGEKKEKERRKERREE